MKGQWQKLDILAMIIIYTRVQSKDVVYNNEVHRIWRMLKLVKCLSRFFWPLQDIIYFLLLSECVTYLMLKVNDLYFCMDK